MWSFNKVLVWKRLELWKLYLQAKAPVTWGSSSSEEVASFYCSLYYDSFPFVFCRFSAAIIERRGERQ